MNQSGIFRGIALLNVILEGNLLPDGTKQLNYQRIYISYQSTGGNFWLDDSSAVSIFQQAGIKACIVSHKELEQSSAGINQDKLGQILNFLK